MPESRLVSEKDHGRGGGSPIRTPELLAALDEAERKAWHSLARYKFMMFGYWAAIWVHFNRINELKRENPFRRLVKTARIFNADKD